MPSCTFFGHRDCPKTIKPKLREVLVDLIINHHVDMFYVGHQGQFDAYALLLCFLLVGCFGRTAVNEDDADGQETIGSPAAESAGPSETTSLIPNGGETEPQSNTKPQDGTKPNNDFATEDSVPNTEPTEMPPNSTDATISGNGGNNVPSTEPSSVPVESAAATTPEGEDDNMPGYGIELPDDDWD